MAQYTVDQVAELVEGSEIEADSDTEVEVQRLTRTQTSPCLGMTLKMRKTRGFLVLLQCTHLHHNFHH